MHLRLVAVTLLLAVPLALAAQQGEAPLPPLPVVEVEGLQNPPAQPPAPAPPQGQAPLPPVAVTQIDPVQPHPELDGERISFAFGEPTPVREILLLLADQTALSIIPDPGIDAAWVGDLKNVTIREALELILEPLGLDYAVRGNIVRVFPRELETRLFAIDYVATARTGTRGTSTSSGAAGASGAGGLGTPGLGGGAVGAAGGSAAGGTSASVAGTDAPTFFDDLEEGVSALLSSEGSMTLDRTAAVLRVTDRESRIERVQQYLDTVMLRVSRQVLIEARVIEVELRDEFSAGINWNAVFSSLPSTLAIGQTLAPATGGGFTMSGNIEDNFTFLLNAFATQGRANVLSSPRVTAMNNQPAIINAGTQDVFFTSTEQRDPQGFITQTTTTPQIITVGVVLSVTPQISADGIIHLSMNPSVTERTGTATSRLGDTVPIVNSRATDTLVRVRDGDTVVIAGLMQDRENTTDAKVPLLGDIPFIGNVFKRTEKQTVKTDLVIMLTPTLMSPTQVSERTAREIRRLDAAQRAADGR